MDGFRNDVNPGVPHVLPVRLTQQRPGLVRPFFFGLGLGGVAYAGFEGWQSFRGEQIGWVFLGVCVLCGLFALLLLWSCFYQLLLSRTPLTLVEISGEPLVAGKSAQMALIQPGPAELAYLRVDLVCLERLTTWHRRAQDSQGNSALYHKVDEKRLHAQTIIEEKKVNVARGNHWQRGCEFTVPGNAKASYDSTDEEVDEDDDTPIEKQIDREILWKIELTGKGGPFTKFLQTFEVKVIPA